MALPFGGGCTLRALYQNPRGGCDLRSFQKTYLRLGSFTTQNRRFHPGFAPKSPAISTQKPDDHSPARPHRIRLPMRLHPRREPAAARQRQQALVLREPVHGVEVEQRRAPDVAAVRRPLALPLRPVLLDPPALGVARPRLEDEPVLRRRRVEDAPPVRGLLLRGRGRHVADFADLLCDARVARFHEDDVLEAALHLLCRALGGRRDGGFIEEVEIFVEGFARSL
jgi:hypothetical protein